MESIQISHTYQAQINSTPHCIHCSGSMEVGYVPESTEVGIGASVWVAGEDKNSNCQGTMVRGKRRYAMAAYRCTDCGYIALFAK